MIANMVIVLFSFFAPVNNELKPDTCEIARIYQSTDIDKDAKVLTMNGSFSRATMLFEPYVLEKGEHNMNLTRKVKDLYNVEGTNIYIETRLCFNIGFKQPSKVVIEDVVGHKLGFVNFQ